MTKPDFYQLHIGQKVWVDGKERIINWLYETSSNVLKIGYVDYCHIDDFDDIDISLSPPLSKRKVTLYRNTYKECEYIWQDYWRTINHNNTLNAKIILTESKEIEIEVNE